MAPKYAFDTAGLVARLVGLFQSCLVTIGCGYSCVELLLGDHILFNQRFIALQIELRLGVVGFRLDNSGLRSLQLMFGLRDL